ncbi:MAG: dipeptidase [bacterium]|nr:dipeptidase [bacterium]
MNKADIGDFHRDALVIDSHNDTIVAHIRRRLGLSGNPNDRKRVEGTVAYLRERIPSQEVQIDFAKMRTGGVDAAFFAVDVTRAWKHHLTYALDAFGFFDAEVEAQGGDVVIARSAADIEAAKEASQLAAVLVIENSDGVEGSLHVLRMLYRLGVRSIGLTHDPRSDAADGNGEAGSKSGLTRFGVALVKEMNRLGMLVDVSHISEPGFWDVMEVTEKPVIASHACCKALCDHSRNLSDEQLKALAENGGVMGVTFVPRFVDQEQPTLARLLDHIDHGVQLVGPDHLGIGSDFDGGGLLAQDTGVFLEIAEGLFERGYSEADVEGILGGNHLRVLRDALGG